MTVSNQPFLDLMWHSHLPCFDTHTVSNRDHEYEMIKWCAWKGIEVPCSVIFAQIPTEKGICCAFNVDVADLYVDHKLKRWIERKQDEERKDAFGGGYQKYGYELEDDWAPRQGRNNGLVLMVDAHSDKLAPASVSDDYIGLTALISSPRQNPLQASSRVLIKPGMENFVKLSASKVKPDYDILNMPPENRGCLFADEMDLGAHKNYRYTCTL